MNPESILKRLLKLALSVCVATVLAFAHLQSEQPVPALDPLAGIPVQVLDQQEIDADVVINYWPIKSAVYPTAQ